MFRWTIETQTGSTYTFIEHEDGSWECLADHVPNKQARDLNGKTIETAAPQPWPAVPGRGISFPYERADGGLSIRRTSPVVRVRGPEPIVRN